MPLVQVRASGWVTSKGLVLWVQDGAFWWVYILICGLCLGVLSFACFLELVTLWIVLDNIKLCFGGFLGYEPLICVLRDMNLFCVFLT